ncbi:DUF7002 family protein [Alicyclobacillus fastidiosus]|uniref:DUF7002 family protein n=1 Tax=Alicyclobacillus fastidiosus TaxID=392011 RepID=UPI00352FFD42
MRTDIIHRMTHTPKRKSLYHFTRVDNLPAIVSSDALYASDIVHPNPQGNRRTEKEVHQLNGNKVLLNAHLHISTEIMDTDTTVRQFRSFLDQHVFLWPTLRLCQQMLQMYSRREPFEKFAVLQLAAYPLLFDHYHQVRLSKYDAGSMPRYPQRTSYRKTLRMFLPLSEFRAHDHALIPRIPSEIHEILIHNSVSSLHRYIETVYCSDVGDIPTSWVHLYKPLQDIQTPRDQV